jgi:hypothetical protein
MICQGYSKMLAPARVVALSRQKSGAVCDSRSNAQNVPVTIRDQIRQVIPKEMTASSQHRCTFLWL